MHLGVTEAGEGEDGRIKSAVGIGTLLEDGLGDTIRVSLTEEPEFEIPVARALADRYETRRRVQSSEFKVQSSKFKVQGSDFQTFKPSNLKLETNTYSPFEYKKRISKEVGNFGNHNVPRVVADYSNRTHKISPANLFAVGYNYSVSTDKWNITDQACDYLFLGNNEIDFQIPGTLGLIINYPVWLGLKNKTRCYPLLTLEEWNAKKEHSKDLNFIRMDTAAILSNPEEIKQLKSENIVFVIETGDNPDLCGQRSAFFALNTIQCELPVLIKRNYLNLNQDCFQLYSATDLGGLLVDGFGDGIWIESDQERSHINSTSFGILQAARTRISKTEYISCPSCGRTLFDLQETTAKIRQRTDHLKGIKLGIMGCIVNGPGEMADADYGYVGTGIGKITLYKGKTVIQRNIPESKAVDALIELIKSNGDWVEKPV